MQIRRLLLTVLLVMLGAVNLSADYLEEQQREARERAAYWEARGYHFDPTYMTAEYMDQKVKDIDRAKYWAARGYNFDGTIMSADYMNEKVHDYERAKYWAARGYNFDASIMSADYMDEEAAKTSPSYPPQSSESDIPIAMPEVPKYAPPRATPVFVTATQGSADAPAVINLVTSTPANHPTPPVVQDANPAVTPAPPPPSFTAGLIQPLAKPSEDTKAHASPTKVTAGQQPLSTAPP